MISVQQVSPRGLLCTGGVYPTGTGASNLTSEDLVGLYSCILICRNRGRLATWNKSTTWLKIAMAEDSERSVAVRNVL